MRPKDVRVSDLVQYTRERSTAATQEYLVCAAIVTGVPAKISDESAALGDVQPTGIDLHVFLPYGGMYDPVGVEFSPHPAGTLQSLNKWSLPTN